MHYLNLNEVRDLQIDHNSDCNLRCPQCARTYKGGTIPELPITELTVEDYHKIIEPIVKRLERINFCGNYGEVGVSKTFMPALEYIMNHKDFNGRIIINTNGSVRNADWWAKLAKILSKNPNSKVAFSIDGLEDTNHIYRVNSKWKLIMNNAKAFIDAGGNARWDYLVFGHNEHQVEEAKKMAQRMGFYGIRFKLTSRFIGELNYQENKDINDSKKVTTRKSKYVLEVAKENKFRPESLEQGKNIIEKYGSWEKYFDSTVIKCKAKPIGKLFVDFHSRVWPCNWVASGMYHFGKNKQQSELHKILNYYGWNFNSLRHNSFDEILSHEFFKESFCSSWKGKQSDAIPRLTACARTCGQEYEFSSIYGKNKIDINFKETINV